ncbi:MAG TPA: glycosyltransferase family 4 protein, partial [Flavipsychrobacter sp.]|nr:glycosyltransferase family 4 protein [Flavipsychrobacter sp.]
ERYYPKEKYRGFKGGKAGFVLSSILSASRYDIIFLGHINMAIIGVAIKRLYPSKKVILITHGIDVWRELTGFKSRILRSADHILSVSNFTRSKLGELHDVSSDRVTVFPNTIDPFFPMPQSLGKTLALNRRYGIDDGDFVIFTLTRLSATELFKGYDKVIEALAPIVKKHKRVKYVIAGRYDAAEKERIDGLVAENNLQGHVILTGFVKEEELVEHYQMADMYIMPSKKEGFGIVFIEALVCGLPVVAGNADGSVDALLNGELGTLVDPDSVGDIRDAILEHVENNNREDEQERREIRQKTLDKFAFDKYRQRLENIIATC